MLRAALDALAPPACLVCRAPPPRTALVCAACEEGLPWLEDPCPPWPSALGPLAWSFAPLAHAGPARDLLLALKLRGALTAAGLMARHIADRAPPGALDGVTLVPVPGWDDRRRRRGFDTAQCLARALGREAGVGVSACLRRADGTRRQVGRGRRDRLAASGFACAGPVPDGPLVLVDDVQTTGATLGGCARTLEPAGNLRIGAVTYVRTLTGS
jgi:predicted amidophosphoribosyltransferase